MYRNNIADTQDATRISGSKLFLIILILLPYCASAQYFVVGQDPASIKWREIKTDNFQIIYPSDYEAQAQRVAHIFEKVYNYSGYTLKHQPKKISVILHTKTIKSNGFVAWSPSRVELFPTPNQEMYSQEWIEQLAIHELRHHVQIDKIESELPAIFKILLGEQASSLVIGAYLPFWFLEGDAVVTETAQSRSGRGRLPSFSMELKAQLDEKGIYSFDKAYLGSYKDYIPDYYQLGYQIVSNIRNQNGGEVWGKVLSHIARNPLSLNSLSRGLKLATGHNQDEHYLKIMNNLKTSNPFGFDVQNDTISTNKLLVKRSKFHTSYRYPYYVDDSSFVALKTSLDKIPSFVLVDRNKNEKKLFSPGLILEESVSYSDGKIAWIESKSDARWENRERSLLRILDIRKGTVWEKTYRDKLFAPVISPDGKRIIAVKFDDLEQCSIVLLSIEEGKILKEFKAIKTNTYFTPSWSVDQKFVYAVELGSKGKSIIRINLNTREIKHLTSPTFGNIEKPIQRGNHLFYTADQNGKNEGYALDLVTKINYRILTAKYGIKDLQSSLDGNYLLFSDYTADGFKIAQKRLSLSKWKVSDFTHWFQDTLSNNLTAQEKGVIDFSTLDTIKFTSRKYLKIKNLINIHSWSPLYIDPDQSIVNTGFSVISQNKLTTAITQFGYDYNSAGKTGKWVGKFEYAGWYPVLRFYGDYGKEKSNYYEINKHFNSQNQLIGQDTVSVPYTHKVMNLHVDVTVPFNLSHGKMYRLVEPEIQLGYTHDWQEPGTPSMIFRGSYIPFTYRLYAHNLRMQSNRDIQSKFGQIIDLHYRHTPFGDKNKGKIAAAEATLYLPGIFENQGIRLYGGYQRKISEKSFFTDIINYPRGYNNMDNKSLFTFRSDYVLPLLSPDWHIWHLYYLKRVTLRVHYDISQINIPIYHSTNTINKILSSTGAELMTNCNFLRFIAPVKIGVRESFLIESKMFTSEFIFSINLEGM